MKHDVAFRFYQTLNKSSVVFHDFSFLNKSPFSIYHPENND